MLLDINKAELAAAETLKHAMEDGADREAAIDLALVRLRALHPDAAEVQLRSLLVRALANECAAAD
jgi:hypothetical protein